ncbi:MAG TPA: DUF5678 domain-containing protein [Thermoanaerobaculia bacterium]|jgi:hypothetical protein
MPQPVPDETAPEADRDAPLLTVDDDPDSAIDKVMLLLDEDRFLTARQMAAEALARFPDNRRVRGAWSIFDNRNKAKVSPMGPRPSRREEFAWLRNPPAWAYGKWVALLGSETVAVADTLAEVLEILKSKTLSRQPLVHRIADGW